MTLNCLILGKYNPAASNYGISAAGHRCYTKKTNTLCPQWSCFCSVSALTFLQVHPVHVCRCLSNIYVQNRVSVPIDCRSLSSDSLCWFLWYPLFVPVWFQARIMDRRWHQRFCRGSSLRKLRFLSAVFLFENAECLFMCDSALTAQSFDGLGFWLRSVRAKQSAFWGKLH